MELAPSEEFEFKRGKGDILLIACGALAREIVSLIEINGWTHLDVICLPAKWHNTPHLIADGVRAKIHDAKGHYKNIYCLYADCGTGGLLDKMLDEEGVERIDGPHCYSFFSGNDQFGARGDEDMKAFFLTDYLARHFDKLIWQGLGLDRHPELLGDYFGNYEKLIFLAQTPDDNLQAMARRSADKLGLAYEYRQTGFGDLATFMERAV